MVSFGCYSESSIPIPKAIIFPKTLSNYVSCVGKVRIILVKLQVLGDARWIVAGRIFVFLFFLFFFFLACDSSLVVGSC